MRLTARQRDLRERYTRTFSVSDDHSARLRIREQEFSVVESTTFTRAEWYRDMLAVALGNLLRAEQSGQDGAA